jgi:hypothetical protein
VRTLRRAVAAPLAVAAAASAVLLAAPAAVADAGLTTSATSTYVLDAKATTVRVTVSLDLHNISPNEVSAGGVYTYYYNAFSVPVPAGAEHLTARSGGTTLGVRLEATEDASTALARITFPDLTYDKTRHIVLTFDVPGEPPRSKDSTRVGPGYATFVVYGPGDAGHNVVRVVVPSSTTFASTTDGFTRTDSGGTTTWTATENTSDGGIWAAVSVRDPAQIAETSVDVAGTSLLLEAFPDDAKWAHFVAATVEDGIPTLEKLVGNPWPGGLQRIREDATPALRGYDGWFDPTDDEIVVGEALDEDLLFHELSHAWVSGERFDQRWVYEGLAQVIADRAVRATGGTPTSHPKVSRSDADAVPLNEWGGSAGSRSTDVDGWAYPATYTATSALLSGMDDATFASVVSAGVRGERAYDPAGTPDHEGGRTTWERWLDLIENRGHSTTAADVFSRWVLTKDQRAQLPARARERTAYAALDRADGAWLPPEGLRDAMTAWDFERAQHVREAVAPLGPKVVAVQQAARAAGVPVPTPVRTSYEKAAQEDQYRALASSLPAAATAITTVGEARHAAAAERDPFTELGARILGVDDLSVEAASLLDAGQVPEATAAATTVTDRAGWALPLGVALPAVVLVLLVGVVLLVVLVWRRSEQPKHARVAQRVRLDPLQVQELRDPLVVGAQQLGVDGRVDGLPVDRLEAVPTEEPGLEGQAEQPRQPELVGPTDEAVEQERPDPVAEVGRLDREGPHLTEVLPQHVQGPAPDDATR